MESLLGVVVLGFVICRFEDFGSAVLRDKDLWLLSLLFVVLWHSDSGIDISFVDCEYCIFDLGYAILGFEILHLCIYLWT